MFFSKTEIEMYRERYRDEGKRRRREKIERRE